MPLADVPPEDFGNPAPEPRQVFAIGLNYANHAAEALLAVPEDLTVFTKFASSLAGPYGTVTLPPGTVDWEDRGLGGRARGNHRPRRLAHTRGQGMESRRRDHHRAGPVRTHHAVDTSDMVFPVPQIIARLSKVTPLFPGDVIFTGTRPGEGVGRVPQRFLAPGDELVTYVRGVGQMRHRMQASS